MLNRVWRICLHTENLALKRPTAQSSTCCCGADRHAVDGITAQNHDNQGYCTHTNADNPSWWRVDLGSNPVPVFEVHIVNRFSNYPSVSSRNVDYKITVGTYLNNIQNIKIQIQNNYSIKTLLLLLLLLLLFRTLAG